tara:strand:+ start:2419 stop:3147 length:729 start_codon:yes stop_codon:yes gene_type:complete
MLYLIGIGLGDERDITERGLELVRGADKVYLESYTSTLGVGKEALEKLYGCDVVICDREMAEQGMEKIVKESKKSNVAFLVIGDVFSATTHTNYLIEARKQKVEVEIVHNASVLTAVGVTGLQLYNFGKVTSIPYHHKDVKGPIDVLKMNQKNGMHTLFLLDLDPSEDRFLSVKEACQYLIENKVDGKTLAVGCARLGRKDFVVKKGTLSSLQKVRFGDAPYSLVIPGKMHFAEEEGLEIWE